MVRYTAEQVEESEAGGLPQPGRYLAEVVADGTEERESKKTGDPMFNVAFKNVNNGKFLCYDTIMLGGRGIGIGHKKLLMIGVVQEGEKEYNVDAIDLIGKRVVLDIAHEHYEKDGKIKTTCKPNFEAENFGYAPASTWVVKIGSGDDESPF